MNYYNTFKLLSVITFLLSVNLNAAWVEYDVNPDISVNNMSDTDYEIVLNLKTGVSSKNAPDSNSGIDTETIRFYHSVYNYGSGDQNSILLSPNVQMAHNSDTPRLVTTDVNAFPSFSTLNFRTFNDTVHFESIENGGLPGDGDYFNRLIPIKLTNSWLGREVEGYVEISWESLNSDITIHAFGYNTNTPPTLINTPTDIEVQQSTETNIDLSNAIFGDNENDTILTVILKPSSGSFTAPTSSGDVTATLEEIGFMSGIYGIKLVGTVFNINNYLNNVDRIKYTSSENASGDNAATITVSVNDGEADLVSDPVINIDIAVNAVPTIADENLTTTTIPEGFDNIELPFNIDDADDDNLTVTISVGGDTGIINVSPIGEYNLTGSPYNLSELNITKGTGTGTADINVTVCDTKNVCTTKVFSISVNAIPTDLNITIPNGSIPEDDITGSMPLDSSDPEDDNITYTLCDNSGDNANFNVLDGNLTFKSNASVNYEDKSTYTVCIKATDEFGGDYEKNVTVIISDTNDAPVYDTSNLSEADGVWELIGNNEFTGVGKKYTDLVSQLSHIQKLNLTP